MLKLKYSFLLLFLSMGPALILSIHFNVSYAGAKPIGLSSTTPTAPSTPGPATEEGGLPQTNSSSSLWNNCGREGYACGECETELQDEFNDILLGLVEGGESRSSGAEGPWSELGIDEDAPIRADATLEGTLQQISDLFRRTNTEAPGKLNYIVIGESESIQQTRPGYPRIALKSPNSELWVTFNTDPELPGYNALEIMRWDGRQGKFLFQEISFPSRDQQGQANHGGGIDLSGKKCIQCHTADPRPNWDTYRSWPGIVPPRDDMLETVELTQNGDVDTLNNYMREFTSTSGEGTPDPSAMAYFNFLDRVAEAREGETANRLGILDIPFDESQVPEEFQNPQSEREKVAAIRNSVSQNGYYRIPHYPNTRENLAYDRKTAPAAGPSHIAFDQLGAQNMCKIVTSISEHPQFDQFKYYLTGMIKCGKSYGFDQIQNFLPSWVLNQSDNHYRSNPSLLRELSGQTPIPNNGRPDDVYSAVLANTESSHMKANRYKQDREMRFLSRYLEDIEGASPQTAEALSRHIAEEKTTRAVNPYHAIADPGGVNGVAEDATKALANLRYGLEPFGVDVGAWSMSIGKNIADKSFSFSDQFFPLIGEERVILDVFEEAGGSCSQLAEMSRNAFNNPNWNGRTPTATSPEFEPIEVLCQNYDFDQDMVPAVREVMESTREIAYRQLRGTAQQALQTCASCHHQDRSEFPFDGLRLDGSIDEEKFRDFLSGTSIADQSYTVFGNYDNASMIINAIGVHHLSENESERSPVYGTMPAGGFRGVEDEARARGMSESDLDRLKRESLALYVTGLRGESQREQQMDQVCRQSVVMQGRALMRDREILESGGLGEGHGQER